MKRVYKRRKHPRAIPLIAAQVLAEKKIERWVIVRWTINERLFVDFVHRNFASRWDGFEFTDIVTHAQSWRSYAAARKYLRSKKKLAGCQVLNFDQVEHLASGADQVRQEEITREQRLFG